MPYITDRLQSLNGAEGSKKEDSLHNLSVSPERKLQTRFRFDVDEIVSALRERIFGQDEALALVENILRITWSDISEQNRPRFISLLVGPTGVGKTAIVELLAEVMHGDKDQYNRIDMNTLAQEHYAAAFSGAPPGYAGSKEGSTIFNKGKVEGTFGKPGIVLFDEVEKADQAVVQALLNVFDNGILRLTSGEAEINFRNSIIFMTSNIGSRTVFEFGEPNFKAKVTRLFYSMKYGTNSLKEVVNRQLEKHFAPEFLNRIDETVVYQWLDEDALDKMIDLLISDLNKRLQKHRCRVGLEEGAKDWLIKKGFSRQYGARELKRVFRKQVEIQLARELHSLTLGENDVEFIVRKSADQLTIEKHG
ncbi:AAA family ATPase [Bacillus canaveralius]|uniref:AAA family ATPase n=1 Tax=Bacillus canaveralius TaxID=1403243 RepID=A0A2N5GHS4_9BACI|nr:MULTISPECIES: AAA family ATPase [Bacillus]PLR80318.1 AAA family ATPase [Bacillus canaveralius]PLR85799.1 AAA family ATPase [Bacillus sp. V33-4]PLR95463.1 AAA family ATPase [Bacillus canaveralius]RSK44038.1 ATP-dependent Clp protease ATP-binding subunit [Bacillus canaveralius]